uniref:Uncharacterized protein n=1 Tax=Megaselia scalaris TaxID=36166 RepID=T1GFG4_MEGSC
ILTFLIFRVYKDTELKHIWRVGPVLNNCSATNKLNTSLPTLSNLGECVIDFDIFPMQISLPKSKQNPNIRYTWPIALLQENGNIFISNASLETLKPKIGQAILIKPKDRRNYGLDSCSIMFMLSSAPTLVIAETSGKIHHALLLQKQDSEDVSIEA